MSPTHRFYLRLARETARCAVLMVRGHVPFILSIRSSLLEAGQNAKGVLAPACKPRFSPAKQ
jgi:hypothetical protein